MRTRTDFVAVSFLIVIVGVLLVVGNRKKLFGPADVIECGNNLRRIYVAYENFVADNGKPLTEVSTNMGGSLELKTNPAMVFKHFEILSQGILAPASCLCPLDSRSKANQQRITSNASVSYFLSITPSRSDAQWIMSGTRNLSFAESLVDIRENGASWNSLKGLHGLEGFFLLGDGSAQKVNSKRAHEMAKTQSSSNLIAIPNE